jgi:hypothetical protein
MRIAAAAEGLTREKNRGTVLFVGVRRVSVPRSSRLKEVHRCASVMPKIFLPEVEYQSRRFVYERTES